MVFLHYKKLDKTLPDLKYNYETDCCFDFVSAIDETIYPNKPPVIVPTGMIFDIPVGYELQIRSRSGLAAKHGVFVTNSPGCADAGFIGEIKVILSNTGIYPFEISKGDRIAQGKISMKPHVVLEEVDEIKSTDRGENGIGSTGVK